MKTLARWTLIYKALCDIQDLSKYGITSNGFKLKNQGICSSVIAILLLEQEELTADAMDATEYWETCKEFLAWMKEVSPEWPSFSGDLDYPVEGGSQEYLCNHKWSGKYSKKRKELLAWLIEKLEAMPVEE